MRLGSLAHGFMTKTLYKTLPGNVGGVGSRGSRRCRGPGEWSPQHMGCRRSRVWGSRGVRGSGIVWDLGVWGFRGCGMQFFSVACRDI